MIIIGGATASGKTALAATVAKMLCGEIVSADSMQIYKDMNIGTAKATDEQLGVKQHLIDVCLPTERFSVVDYRKLAECAVRNIESQSKPPIIAGGTGFYISSLLTEYEYGNDSDPKIRAQLEAEYKDFGAECLHAKLKQCDPQSASKIHPNNIKRVIRALEVFSATGKPFSQQNNIKHKPLSPFLMFVLHSDSRKLLYERIDNRVDEMLASGLEQEVSSIISKYNVDFDAQAMQGIGYKEWKPYFEGTNCPISEVANAIKKNTREYAKRQQTWFLHQYKQDNVTFLDCNQPIQKLAEQIAAAYKLQLANRT